MTTLSEITNSLGVTVSLAGITCYIKSTYVKGASIEGIDTRVAKTADVRGPWVRDVCIETFCTKDENLISRIGCICDSIYKPSKLLYEIQGC